MCRCKIKLKQVNKKPIKLKYMHELMQGMIYQMPSKETSKRLHERGIRSLLDTRRLFKEVAFSTLRAPRYEILNDGKEIRFNDDVFFYLASPDEEILRELVEKIAFSPEIKIGDARFIPIIDTRGDVLENCMLDIDVDVFDNEKTVLDCFTITPIVVSDSFRDKDGRQKTKFYYPDKKAFYEKVTNNLKNKFSAYYKTNDLSKFHFNIACYNFKLKGVYYKNTLLIGSEGNFRLETNYETAKVINAFGLGAKNAQGLGQVMF